MAKISRIDTVHQLRALMCALHVKTSPAAKEKLAHQVGELNHHLLDWIALEKDSQPPSIIVVVDLLEYLVQDDTTVPSSDVRYSTIK